MTRCTAKLVVLTTHVNDRCVITLDVHVNTSMQCFDVSSITGRNQGVVSERF